MWWLEFGVKRCMVKIWGRVWAQEGTESLLEGERRPDIILDDSTAAWSDAVCFQKPYKDAEAT